MGNAILHRVPTREAPPLTFGATTIVTVGIFNVGEPNISSNPTLDMDSGQ